MINETVYDHKKVIDFVERNGGWIDFNKEKPSMNKRIFYIDGYGDLCEGFFAENYVFYYIGRNGYKQTTPAIKWKYKEGFDANK
jgi:hypothetical protein